MNATIPMNTPPPAPAPPKGFDLRCPLCGDAEGSIRIAAHDVRRLHCEQCGESFIALDVKAMYAKWLALFAWMETCPEAE